MKSRLDTLREIEDELNIRLSGRSSQPKPSASGGGSWEFRGKTGGVTGRMRQLGRRGGSGNATADPRQQRVVVKASYSVHRAGTPGSSRTSGGGSVLRAHVRYLARDSASLDGQAGKFYDATEQDVDAKQRVQAWEHDRHHFRFIISPEYADQIDRQPSGMTGYVRELVAQMEQDLGTPLEWVAINHYNTDDRHAHLLVRGKREDGSDLVIPRRYMSHGMRQAAQEIATHWIGERTAEQVNEALQEEMRAERFTPLDAVIERQLDGDHRLRLRSQGRRSDDELRRRVAGRLQHLEGMGLATRDRHGRWTVDADLKRKLRELAFRGDTIKNLYAKLGQRSAFVSRYRGEELTGRVVSIGVHDELRDRRYLAVEDSEGRTSYVLPANPQALSVLEEGGLVRVSAVNHRLARTDARIAEVARAGGGVYRTEAHRQQLAESFSAGDMASFLRSHERRLQTLERLGAATQSSAGWTVHNLDALERGDHARHRHDTGFVEVVSARSIESQVQAEAWTWLDRQLYVRSLGKATTVPFDAALEQTAEQRRQWMVEHGYTASQDGRCTLRPGVLEALRRHEWRAVEPTLRQRFGRPAHPLAAGAEVNGTYRGAVALHDGLRAVIGDRSRVHFVPVQQAPPLAAGTKVRAKVNAQGRGVLVATAGRERERGAER